MTRFQSVTASLPPEIARALRRFEATQPRTPEELAARVRAYHERVRRKAPPGVLVNFEQSDRIAAVLEGLIAGMADLPMYEKSLVQGAVLYYSEPDDASGDLESAFGFDDDALVVDAVAQLIADLRDSL